MGVFHGRVSHQIIVQKKKKYNQELGAGEGEGTLETTDESHSFN